MIKYSGSSCILYHPVTCIPCSFLQERGTVIASKQNDYVFINRQQIEKILSSIFSSIPISIERVVEGVSTYVYRVVFPHETFYLRILPEENTSFAPEVAVHTQLRQMQIKVPEVLHFEHYNDLLQRSLMLTTEIKGQPISQSTFLSHSDLENITREAGRDLAQINTLPVEGFGWIKRDQAAASSLKAEWPSQRAFALEFWESDLAYLAQHVLTSSEIDQLTALVARIGGWLDGKQGYLAHGDFDTTHIFQDQGRYTGIIDFGEIRGANRSYDMAHFHFRDGEALPFPLLPALLQGYKERYPLPDTFEQQIRFIGLLINVRALARALQKRPADRYTEHQLLVLRKDLAAFHD